MLSGAAFAKKEQGVGAVVLREAAFAKKESRLSVKSLRSRSWAHICVGMAGWTFAFAWVTSHSRRENFGRGRFGLRDREE